MVYCRHCRRCSNSNTCRQTAAAGSLACLFSSNCTDRCTVLLCLCRLSIEPAAYEILTFNILHQRSSIGTPRAASGPPASCLWPPNCYSFTMCFGWVSTSTPGLVSMPTIHRQLGHSLLQAQFLTFNLVFGAVRILTFLQ